MADTPATTKTSLAEPLGDSGLKAYGGYLREEFIRELQGAQGRRIYREMSDNDATVGAIVEAFTALICNVEWTVTASGDTPEAEDAKKFVEEVIEDMDVPLSDVMAEACTMFIFGFAPMEITLKIRAGRKNKDKRLRSKFDDGKWGVREIALRGQTSLQRWQYDDETGELKGMWQQATWKQSVMIPIERLLLFRTQSVKNNPEGRALDPETPIPTPDGWRRMDDLQPGDKVFDEEGRIRYVTARADWEDRPAYKITFGDGSEIVADANHQWPAQSFADRNTRRISGRLRTTEEMAKRARTKGGHVNFTLPWAGALDYPEQALPIDPYFLGLWLGDGTSRAARISCHLDDVAETVDLIEACGFRASVSINGGSENGRTIDVRGEVDRSVDAPQRILRAMGVLENKHIPAAYMRGSISQRMALLAGLMDSDGHVDGYGRCEFSQVDYGIAQCVADLVRSLGISPYLTTKKNSAGNQAWLVKFTPDFIPFRLSRKAARCKPVRARKHHYIHAIDRVENRRTVCIEVDGPSHLFLAGSNMAPTHNSILRRAYRSWFYKTKFEEIEAIGVERDLAGLPVGRIPAEYLDPDADPRTKAIAAMYQRIITQLRREPSEGIIIPSDPYEAGTGGAGQRKFEISLLTSGGGRTFDINAIISRVDRAMATSVLMDFLFLGQQTVGSFALSSDKTALFATALGSYLKRMATTLNQMVDYLWEHNDFDEDVKPTLTPGDIEKPDLAELGGFISTLVGAGAQLFPDRDLENFLRKAGGLPLMAEEDGLGNQGAPGAGDPGSEDPAAQESADEWQVQDPRRRAV